MLKWMIAKRLAAFEKRYAYDMSYAREILAVDTSAILVIAKLQPLGNYRKDVPKETYWAAKLVGTLSEDCGPCTQLLVSMALEAGVEPKHLAAVLANDEAAMTDNVKLGVAFARTALAHDPDADTHREAVKRRWGDRAVVALAFAIVASRIYPTLKYALGHGKTCQRVTVAGTPIAVAKPAVA